MITPSKCEVCGNETKYRTEIEIEKTRFQACEECRAVKYENIEILTWVLRLIGKLPVKTILSDML